MSVDLAKVLEAHVEIDMSDAGGQNYCDKCMQAWPCDAIQLAEEVERLDRLEAEAWGIRFCCNGRDCGCQGQPIDPPAWWTPDIRALQDDLTTLRAANAKLVEREQECPYCRRYSIEDELGDAHTYIARLTEALGKPRCGDVHEIERLQTVERDALEHGRKKIRAPRAALDGQGGDESG